MADTNLQKYHKWMPGSSLDPCVFCNRIAGTIDHIMPKSKGGINDMYNFAPMCKWCNTNKSSSSVLMALMNPKIKRRIKFPYAPDKEFVPKKIVQKSRKNSSK